MSSSTCQWRQQYAKENATTAEGNITFPGVNAFWLFAKEVGWVQKITAKSAPNIFWILPAVSCHPLLKPCTS